MMRTYNLPKEAAMGYAESLYPEFRKRIKGLYTPPASCGRYCCGWIERQGCPARARARVQRRRPWRPASSRAQQVGRPAEVKQALLAAACLLGVATAAHAQRPDLSGNWIANGGKTIFGEWHLTGEGERRFKRLRLQEGRPGAEVHRHELDARLAQPERRRAHHAG